jgi:cyclin-dependent kinase 7
MDAQALNHPYFFALPNPSHPSKLPKSSNVASTRPLEEVDGNVEQGAAGPVVKATAPNRLKRKLNSPGDELTDRSIARRLDFSQSNSHGSTKATMNQHPQPNI